MNKSDQKIQEIKNKVRKNLDPYFIKFCSLEALENFPIDLKKSLYYYVVENIIGYVYESSFKEVMCHPEIIKKVRKGQNTIQILVNVFIIFFSILLVNLILLDDIPFLF